LLTFLKIFHLRKLIVGVRNFSKSFAIIGGQGHSRDFSKGAAHQQRKSLTLGIFV
jgi:hypothetical protein